MKKRDSLYLAKLEAIIFAAGESIAKTSLASILDLDLEQVDSLVQQIKLKYQRDPQSGLKLVLVEDKVLILAKDEYRELLARLFRPEHQASLSPAAYEVLAVIAYNEVATRAQIEAVRGVNSDSVLNRLIERGLVETLGQLDLPGRPQTYGVSKRFLIDMGLESTKDLPAMDLLLYDTLKQFDYKEKASEREVPDRP